MTPEQTKKYEEAAKAWIDTYVKDFPPSPRQGFLAGAELASQGAEERVKTLTTALNKINDIRNSIIGYQSINWSAHIYPMVAALNEAGFEGMGYEEAKKMAKDQLARIKELEDRVKQSHNDAIDKALAIVKDAYYSDSEDKILAIEGQIQKLKL